MGKLTAKQVIAYSKADPKKYSDGEGLYFCVRKQGSPYWMIRYTTAISEMNAKKKPFSSSLKPELAILISSTAMALKTTPLKVLTLNRLT